MTAAPTLRRELGFFDAAAIVVSSVIGTGIFLTAGAVAKDVPHPAWLLLAWVLGGVLSLAGAFINAELGAVYPAAGGDYVFLREAFHPLAGFLVGWMTFFIIYAGTLATLAMGLATGLPFLAPLLQKAHLKPAVAATFFIVLVSALNYVSVRASAAVNRVTTIVKVGALVVLGVLGLVLGREAISGEAIAAVATTPVTPSAFTLAFVPIVFTYSGWNAAVYVAGEIREPKKNIPRALVSGLALCTGAYVLLNLAWMRSVPFRIFVGAESPGAESATRLFGASGAIVTACVIGVSVFGCLAVNALVGARIAYALGDDGLLPTMNRVHPRFVTPHRAVVLQAVVTIAIIVGLDSFSRVLDYTTFALLLATMADAGALVALRRKHPTLDRPYSCPGYPWLPALYIALNGAIALQMVLNRTLECVISVGVLAAGLPFYFVLKRGARRRARSDDATS